jgi:hypothetical protein
MARNRNNGPNFTDTSHAEMEELVDKSETDNAVVRVAGPGNEGVWVVLL